jgi:hypothetical protein
MKECGKVDMSEPCCDERKDCGVAGVSRGGQVEWWVYLEEHKWNGAGGVVGVSRGGQVEWWVFLEKSRRNGTVRVVGVFRGGQVEW